MAGAMIYKPRYFWSYPNDYVVSEEAHQKELARLAAMPIDTQTIVGDGQTVVFKLKHEYRQFCEITIGGYPSLETFIHHNWEVSEQDSQFIAIYPPLEPCAWFKIKYHYAGERHGNA